MPHKPSNTAYIDGANLYRSIKALGWTLDYTRFRNLLRLKYGVRDAYIFIGYSTTYTTLYAELEKAGFTLVFKETNQTGDGELKGNVDADLVWKIAHDDCQRKFEKAVLVTGDGDFATMAKDLGMEDKLRVLLCPSRDSCSKLLRQHPHAKPYYPLTFLEDFRARIELQ